MSLAETKEKKAHVWARDERDWYVEPERVTRQLLKVERFVGGVWDPACGKGNIVRTMIANGTPAIGSDVADRAGSPDWYAGRWDFLEASLLEIAQTRIWSFGRNNIVCNPPYFRAKGAEAFCRRALEICQGKVAMFLDIKFLPGGKRGRGLYAEFPPSRVWILSDRPSCPPGEYLEAGNEAGGGTADYIWVVWDRSTHVAETRLGWLTEAV